MSFESSKRKPRSIPPLRSTTTSYQKPSGSGNPTRPSRTAEKSFVQIQNARALSRGTESRYPNYLPELKAKRAKVIVNGGGSGKDFGSRLVQHNTLAYDEYERFVLEGLKRIADPVTRARSQIRFGNPSVKVSNADDKRPSKIATKLNANDGQPYFLQSENSIRRSNDIQTLYRAPSNKIREWDIDSPRQVIELMRKGLEARPRLSQLPSPVSSQALLYETKRPSRRAKYY